MHWERRVEVPRIDLDLRATDAPRLELHADAALTDLVASDDRNRF